MSLEPVVGTYSNQLARHEICVIENMWRDRILKARYVNMFLAFHNVLSPDTIMTIARVGEKRVVETRRESTDSLKNNYLLFESSLVTY